MNADQLNRLTSSVLVTTTQMAYVEEAPGTHALLEDFTEIFRYLTKEKKAITLEEEWKILRKYIHLQLIRYPGRFEVEIEELKENNIYVYSGMILEFFDQYLTQLLDSSESTSKILFRIIPGSPNIFDMNNKQLELPYDL